MKNKHVLLSAIVLLFVGGICFLNGTSEETPVKMECYNVAEKRYVNDVPEEHKEDKNEKEEAEQGILNKMYKLGAMGTDGLAIGYAGF